MRNPCLVVVERLAQGQKLGGYVGFAGGSIPCGSVPAGKRYNTRRLTAPALGTAGVSYQSKSQDAAMDDLDLPRLADYLHLTPDQVKKMALRGKIPGRKVAGEWRFSEAEIHHWLEDRIGASDLEGLDRVQRVIDRAAAGDTSVRQLAEMCVPETIAIPLNSRTRGSVIRSMCELATKTGMLWDAAAMAEAVRAREQLHPTALDCGVALLHPRRPQTSILADSVISLGVCQAPIPFSDSGQLTDVFFLICSYDDATHLRILAKLSRLITDAGLLERLRASESAKQAWEHLKQAELQIDGHGSH